MSKSEVNPQERTARELLTQRPLFLGVDGVGDTHYWDSYDKAVVVVAGDDAEKVKSADTRFWMLGEWCEYTREERGWDEGPHVGGSLVGDLVRGVDA
ncbi:hypothetical protein EGH21_21845 [Halomicroarcula sp. F13]|uniref:Uncharacterized protein n=1 Tax=Haloarcula rubra TaxID=2487747 RepID=A0AAW4PZK7_9EURY|nr:hypothetical protein [Halomicroarcula rubra]MBX0325663.1 hypothetical protein [Halomicroarcula rubra]